MAKQPYAQRQFVSWNFSEIFAPAYEQIIHGDAVKAKANPLSRSVDVSTVMTSTAKMIPMKPTE